MGRYVFAVLVVVLAALLRHGLTGFFGNKTFYITFYPAVMVVATLAGFGPGVLAMAVAALIADYWILPPTGQFMGKDISDTVSLGGYDPSRFDLVITDQTMPDMTGFELAREILAVRPDMPVILATGFSSLVNEESAREAGIKAFVMKPLTKKEIANTIREVL
jgi:CheY-like chemotaxis protein